MKIQVNGKDSECPSGVTVAALLDQLGLSERRVAVEINREIVPRSAHPVVRLQEHDRVEIVTAIGGG